MTRGEVALSPADGMPKNCWINCDVLLTVPKARIRNRITALAHAKIAEVEQALKFAMDLR